MGANIPTRMYQRTTRSSGWPSCVRGHSDGAGSKRVLLRPLRPSGAGAALDSSGGRSACCHQVPSPTEPRSRPRGRARALSGVSVSGSHGGRPVGASRSRDGQHLCRVPPPGPPPEAGLLPSGGHSHVCLLLQLDTTRPDRQPSWISQRPPALSSCAGPSPRGRPLLHPGWLTGDVQAGVQVSTRWVSGPQCPADWF